MSKINKSSKASAMSSKRNKLKKELWPALDESELWQRKKAKGFSTVPRTLPYIFEIMDSLTEKGKPISRVYFSLWCRLFDEGFIEIKNYSDLAYEAGFSGQRAVSTWKTRMRILEELQFIRCKEGISGKFHYVLILNPYKVLKELKSNGKLNETQYFALYNRAQEVGAIDLED